MSYCVALAVITVRDLPATSGTLGLKVWATTSENE